MDHDGAVADPNRGTVRRGDCSANLRESVRPAIRAVLAMSAATHSSAANVGEEEGLEHPRAARTLVGPSMLLAVTPTDR